MRAVSKSRERSPPLLPTIVETASFSRRTDILLDKDGMAPLMAVLADDPLGGDLIPDTGGIRKLRFGRPGSGRLDMRALQDWGQGRRMPDRAALVLFRIIRAAPAVAAKAAADQVAAQSSTTNPGTRRNPPAIGHDQRGAGASGLPGEQPIVWPDRPRLALEMRAELNRRPRIGFREGQEPQPAGGDERRDPVLIRPAPAAMRRAGSAGRAPSTEVFTPSPADPSRIFTPISRYIARRAQSCREGRRWCARASGEIPDQGGCDGRFRRYCPAGRRAGGGRDLGAEG
jgi:hypothetical protein